jgi:tetratricopeptide (TPR) repeat protein
MVGRSIGLLLGLLLAVAQATGQADLAQRREAGTAISAHKFQDAIQILSGLIKSNPRDASLWTLQGVAFSGLGDEKQSLASFDTAIQLDPEFVPALEGAAQTAYLHRSPQAARYVQKLLVIAPGNTVANAMAGALSYQSHECLNAVKHFKISEGEVYKSPNALSEFADCLLKDNAPDEAAEVLSRGVQLHPDSVELNYNLAVVELQLHHPADAIQILEPLSAEKDAALLNLLASSYTQAGRPDDAFRTLEDAIRINPQEQFNYLDLAILCLEHNQENLSIEAASAGIARINKPTSLYLIRGVAYAQLAQYDKAEGDFAAAARIDPNQDHSTIAMSLLYSERNQPVKEKQLLIRHLQSTPNDAVANYLLADLLMRSGAEPGKPEFTDAEKHLQKSLAVKPDSAEAQILMGKLLEQQKDFAGALSHFEAALRIEPNNQAALDQDFLILRKLHRNQDAAVVLIRLKAVLSSQLAQEQANAQVRVNQ